MKKSLLLVVMLPLLSFAQYNQESSTEQSFENSNLFFKSHYLNTFGLHRFKQVSAGLIDDPFLNLYLNPAFYPNLTDDDALIYIDFRSDRTEANLFDDHVMPMSYYSSSSFMPGYPDPRWLTLARSEPEPIVSIGMLANPLSKITKKFFIGGSYQLMHKQEKFYQMPYWIYYPNFYKDNFGSARIGLQNVPIIDRFSGKDEMTLEGHFFTLYSGYKLTDKLSLGASFNGVNHSREGGYLNSYRDEYGSTDKTEYRTSQLLERNQIYNHADFSLGANYSLSDKSLVGMKVGLLKGKANQDYSSQSSYYSKNNIPEVSSNWWLSDSKSSTFQNWKHDGTSKYIGVNINHTLSEGKEMSGFYRYTLGNEDIINSSKIYDTTYYSSRWTWDTTWSYYRGSSLTSDKRTGDGFRKRYNHEVLIRFKSKLTSSSIVTVGLYFNSMNTDCFTSEPVSALRISDYLYRSSKYPQRTYYLKLSEAKVLEWNYNSRIWSLQIPVILDYAFSENFGLMIGVNRILSGSEIKDETIAYFTKRERVENGTTTIETNFGERYKQPTKKFTESYFDLIGSINVKISDAFKVKLLLNLEIEPKIRMAQGWLSFEMRL
ncbi:MAG: hypothetical protein U1C46_02225 [Bacteroidales bacterium]|nr:hypothetical protein [Bacteroidales bacterium]MDZ4203612.1 hypothetical protein [Bacteroidales bacterium]